jgi:hypothetical protein
LFSADLLEAPVIVRAAHVQFGSARMKHAPKKRSAGINWDWASLIRGWLICNVQETFTATMLHISSPR